MFCSVFLIVKVLSLSSIDYWSVPILLLDLFYRFYQCWKIVQSFGYDKNQVSTLLQTPSARDFFFAGRITSKKTIPAPSINYMFYENNLWIILLEKAAIQRRELPTSSVNVSIAQTNTNAMKPEPEENHDTPIDNLVYLETLNHFNGFGTGLRPTTIYFTKNMERENKDM